MMLYAIIRLGLNEVKNKRIDTLSYKAHERTKSC